MLYQLEQRQEDTMSVTAHCWFSKEKLNQTPKTKLCLGSTSQGVLLELTLF